MAFGTSMSRPSKKLESNEFESMKLAGKKASPEAPSGLIAPDSRVLLDCLDRPGNRAPDPVVLFFGAGPRAKRSARR